MDKLSPNTGDDVFQDFVRPADNLPTGGNDKKPDKVTYKNGTETKREPTN